MQERNKRQFNPSAENGFKAMPLFGMAMPGNVFATQTAFFDVTRSLSDIWSRSARDLMTGTTELTTRLAQCKSPTEAPAVYADWMQDRVDRLLLDGQEAMSAWQDAMKSALSGGSESNGSGTGEN